MTTVSGVGQVLPYLISDFWPATTIAIAVVFIELLSIVLIQNRFMDTAKSRGTFQVVPYGALVFGYVVLIGNT